MKLLCDAKKFYDSIANSADKEKFIKKYGEPLRFSGGILVSLPSEKTLTQNGAFWLDMTKIAKLLYTDKETIYYWLLKAVCLKDVWLEETTYGKSKKKTFRFRSLSELSKSEMSEFFPRYREYLQAIVNKEYGEFVVINWANIDNIGEPDYEFGRT